MGANHLVRAGADQPGRPIRARLKQLAKAGPTGVAYDFARNPRSKSHRFLRLAQTDNLFQPVSETAPNRYPRIFRFVQERLEDSGELRVLSFGCSTGEEVFSLRRYFPRAEIRGLDINPLHIAICRGRRRSAGDRRLSFAVAGSADQEQAAMYDAIFCMAVFRHGGLSFSDARRCDHLITFDAFERTISGLARCLKDGGLLAIRHANFRLCDTASAECFRPVFRVEEPRFHPQAPLFGPDNRRLDEPFYPDVVFEKLGGPSNPTAA
jgi:SAM-dependent methyltransferase